jgi:hypothetical protein
MQPPNIENFLSLELMEAMDRLSLRDEGMVDLEQSSEGTPSPSLGPSHQGVPGGSALGVDYFEAVSAEVAAAATRAIDYWSPPLRLLERQSAVSATAKAAAFPLAAGAADVVAAIGEPADAAESAPSHIITEDSTADEDASEGEWWW